MPMIVSLCGTPGVGKTTTAALLRDRGIEVISEKETIKEMGLYEEYDITNDEYIVDLSVVREGLTHLVGRIKGDAVIEGHLSYLAPSDLMIIMRLDPSLLSKRLNERGYSVEKVKENIEAEALGYLLTKALEEEDRVNGNGDRTGVGKVGRVVVERDVTGLSPEDIAAWIIEMMEAEREKRLSTILHYRPGKVDWLEEWAKWF